MTETSQEPSNTQPELPPAPRIVRKRRGISWIWIVPIIAALAGMSMMVRTWMATGPSVIITFATGNDIEVGKTQLRYKEVAVGVVEAVHLSKDRSRVEVSVSLNQDAADVAREGSRFWIVRPRLSLSGVSGLGTIMSGVYIAVDIPAHAADAASRYEFEGLDLPPQVASDRPGSRYTMRASTLGSLDIGSPVYFRHVRVGQIVGYQLDANGKHVDLQVFVDAPFDRFVSSNTRFWNASGMDLSVDASGLALHVQSLTSVLAGGVVFEDVLDAGGAPVAADHVFDLFANERDAHKQAGGVHMSVSMRVNGSVRGVARGADVDFRGLSLGNVTALRLDFDQSARRFYTVIEADLYPERFGQVYHDTSAGPDGRAQFLATMVKHGLRAQLRTSNFLTGQSYVALDFFPDAPPVIAMDAADEAYHIPVMPGAFDQTSQQIANIITKLDQLPLAEIGANLQRFLGEGAGLLTRANKELAPALTRTLIQAHEVLAQINTLMPSEVTLTGHIERTMQELTRTARSLRELIDTLLVNPGMLLRGRMTDPTLFEGKH